jgi:Subtilisin inhibitor-like
MRIAAVTLAALAATGCMGRASSGSSDGTSPAANLEISISIRGSEAPTKVWTLRCPDGGTLPDAAAACRKLGQVQDPFAPVPKDAACPQIYGGPEIADVRGTFRGHPVATRFSRGNGCEIERWSRVRFLFPGVS